MRYYHGNDIAGIYEEILYELLEEPDFITSPRGMEVREIRDCSMEIENPMLNIYHNDVRGSKLKYVAAEILWYFSGTNNPTYIEKHASLWKNLHNENGTVNSAYGNLLFTEKNEHGFTQYQWVINSLKNDKDSRQAFMHFNKPHHQYVGNKDQVCTLQALFHIRDNKLYMTLTMRSNDVILGFMTDFTFFSILQYHVFLHLKEYYKDLVMGSYTHISHSMHLYEKHYNLVNKMLNSTYEPSSLPLLDETIINEWGGIKADYFDLLMPICRGDDPDYNQETGNPLIDWCLKQLK